MPPPSPIAPSTSGNGHSAAHKQSEHVVATHEDWQGGQDRAANYANGGGSSETPGHHSGGNTDQNGIRSKPQRNKNSRPPQATPRRPNDNDIATSTANNK